MLSPFASALTKLDDSLETLDSLVARLEAGLPVDEEQLAGMLRQACQESAALREIVCAEKPEADWSDRDQLQQLIAELEAAAEAQRDQERRDRLMELAATLEAGTVKHRFEGRTAALNALRRDAIDDLRAQAQAPGQAAELPGPAPSEWLPWAFNLEDDKDAIILSELGNDFSALERFTGEMEESYWMAAQPGAATLGPGSNPRSGDASAHSGKVEDSGELRQQVSLPQNGDSPEASSICYDGESGAAITDTASVEKPSTAAAVTDPPLADAAEPADGNGRTHSAPAGAAGVAEPAVAHESVAGAEAADDGESHAMSDEMFAGVEPPAPRKPLVMAGVAGFVLLSIVFFWLIYHFHGKSGTKAQTVEAASATTAAAQPAVPALLHKQPDEGAQSKILLSVEKCDRGNAGSIECWGYVSNLGDASSRVALDRVDVVDGRGNTVTLDRNGQIALPSGRSSTISAGANVKYTMKIPDQDQTAKTLTLYVDLSSPKSLEYTFRNIPVSD
jgi:hypothetical protein